MNNIFFFIAGLFLFLALVFQALPTMDSTVSAEPSGREKATFAGGCFWCMEKPFEKVDGVLSVTSGYTGGRSENPTYKNYGAGGHIEAIEIVYDPAKVTYEQLLDIFWRQLDPTDAGGQFVDRGREYSSAIFYHDEEQKKAAEISKKDLGEKKIFEIKDKCGQFVNLFSHTIQDEATCRTRCRSQCQTNDLVYSNVEFEEMQMECNKCICHCK